MAAGLVAAALLAAAAEPGAGATSSHPVHTPGVVPAPLDFQIGNVSPQGVYVWNAKNHLSSARALQAFLAAINRNLKRKFLAMP